MKKTLFFLLVSILPIISIGQNYIPIPPDSSSQWRIRYQWHYKSFCLQVDDARYFFQGDTVINSKTYKKLYASGIHYEQALSSNSNCNTTIAHFENVYYGAFRNDSGKVYCILNFWVIHKNEFLIYDFSLNVGDTVPGYYNTPYDIVTIASIDTIIINGRQHKQFNLDNGYQKIIEGIGSIDGLLIPAIGMFENASFLLCYAEDTTPVYPDNSGCILNIGFEEIPNSKKQITIYPNPAKDYITIDIGVKKLQDCLVEIYNTEGQRITSSEKRAPSNELDISKLNPGLYFGRVIFKDGNTGNFKFIVK